MPDHFILNNSELVFIDSNTSLVRGKDYLINYTKGEIRIVNFSKSALLKIFYQILPTDLKNEYFLNRKIYDTSRKVISIKKESIPIISSTKDLFGEGITKTGSIIRGFSFGSNKDMTLNSGFRLEMNGKISEDISITASLTDENTPIMPEGNTQSIKEIDKVFIDIKHHNFDLTLGDFFYENTTGGFSRFSRKLKGGKVDFNFNNVFGGLSFASPNGKFASDEFYGIDGVQGPYKLKSAKQSSDILIIPGSEKIYLDGKLLKRGDLEDYIIDYSTAEIIFTIKNVIKNNSRILIDFEFNDRRYNRSFLSANAGIEIIKDKLQSSIIFIQEGDDKDAPIDFEMSDEIKNLIGKAGVNQFKAYTSGVRFIGFDSSTMIGKGQYIKIDTIINDFNYSYFIYHPGVYEAQYSVAFSLIGTDQGDYIRESIGNFKWVGKGKGNYLPIQLFALPERNRNVIWNLSAIPFNSLKISSELALSNFNKNTLSEIKADENGLGYNIKLDFKDTIGFLNTNLGELKLKLIDRYISETYSPIDRIDEIDYYRNWNINDSTKQKRNIIEVETGYKIGKLDINYIRGINNFGVTNRSDKNEILFNYSDSLYPSLKFEYRNAFTHELTTESDFSFIKATSSYSINPIDMNILASREKKQIQNYESGLLLDGSIYNTFSGILSLIKIKDIKLRYELELRTDESVYKNLFMKESQRHNNRFIIEYNNKNNINTMLTMDYQKINFTTEFLEMGNKDQENLILKSYFQFNTLKSGLELNLFYETSGQNTAINQRVYLRVEKGTGNYQYIGDINNNGIADDNEFIQVKYDGDYLPIVIKTDKYIPVTDLKTSIRLRFNPRRFILRPDNFYEKILNSFSSETYAQINELNKDSNPSNIYFLRLSNFLNENLTIKGNNNFTQDIFLLENTNLINVRLRYMEKNSLNQYTFGYEQRKNIERSIRIRFRFLDEFSNQTDMIFLDESSSSPANIERNFIITGFNMISNFSYRPEQNLEIGFQIETGKKEDGLQNVFAFKNSQSIRSSYSFQNAGFLQIEFERTEITLQNNLKYMYYNLTDGLKVGKNWFLKVNLGYQITSFIQSNLNYFGRVEGNNFLHNASMEVQLFF